MLRLIPRMRQETPEPLLAAGYSPHLARVLWARGVRTAREAEAFLRPELSQLHDPFALHGMARAVERTRKALALGERITVYGDYDVDGVCAAALLVEALRDRGADATWYIPSRHREGYGLNPEAVRAAARECRLLITVDCGITSLEEAALAKTLGLDLIVTDHHEPAERLPEAVAVVNPLLGDYPFRRLCGAGVALKLVQALFGPEAAEPLLELAALATVADLVPLLGENRVLAAQGLSRMQRTPRPGLRALIDVSGLSGKTITAGHLAFQIGPRINAGGRLQDASRNVELLLTDDGAKAQAIARELSAQNAQRQRMETDILAQAEERVRADVDFLAEKAVVVQGEGWNTGVVGLVASRLAEKFSWPAVVLSRDGDVCVGSARSIPGVNLHAALTKCADLFLRFGGHAQAAGMTLLSENVPAFRARLNEAVAQVAERDAFVPSLPYDLDAELSEITIPAIEQLERLAPTGFGNPAPVFRLTDARVLEARAVGSDGRHLKLRLEQGSAVLDGIAFGQAEESRNLPDRVDALFSPAVNEFQGRRSAQCEIARLLPHAPLAAFRDQCRARADDFDLALLDAPPAGEAPACEQALRAIASHALGESCQGTLLTVRTLEGALRWLDWLEEAGLSSRLDYCFHRPADPRRFNALCAMPEEEAGRGYARALALDDALVPRAAAGFVPTDEALRDLYRALRAGKGTFPSERALAEAAGLKAAAVRLGLRTFAELGLAAYRPVPFQAALLPAKKRDLLESAQLRRARELLGRGVEA